jgi:N-acyl amino acid synthase of PEP-CTERM/exosortase system
MSAGLPMEPDLLKEVYERYFEIVLAETPELLERAFRLRYEVYCVEHPFLNAAANLGGRETDAFDGHSAHALLVHRASGATCGTVRLILPDRDHPTSSFPVAQVSPSAAAMMRKLPPLSTAEISRFAVSKSFRRRVGEDLYPDVGEMAAPPNGVAERRLLPHITYGLIRACLLMSLNHKLTHLAAVMEPALMRLVARLGLCFKPVGELVEYHGMRQPCCAAIDDLVDGVREAREDIWAAGTEGGRLLPATAMLERAS